jgi:hypothetical protein
VIVCQADRGFHRFADRYRQELAALDSASPD